MDAATLKVRLISIQDIVNTLIDDIEQDIPLPIGNLPTIPMRDGTDFTIPDEWVREWAAFWGMGPVVKCIKEAAFWSANQPRSKRKKNARQFLGNWMLRSAEKASPTRHTTDLADEYERKNAGGHAK